MRLNDEMMLSMVLDNRLVVAVGRSLVCTRRWVVVLVPMMMSNGYCRVMYSV